MSDEHIRRTYVVEDKWKCTSCQRENLGRHVKCQHCGSPKEKFETDTSDAEGAPEVTDPELLKIANAGANWVCTYCGAQDRAPDGRCRNCGARQEEARSELPDAPPEPAAAPATQPAASKKRHPVLLTLGAILGFCVLVLGYCVMPHEKAATVAAARWNYTATLEQRLLLHGSGFSWPGDAFNRRCETRQRGYHDCNPYPCHSHSESYDCHPHDCNCHKESRSKKNGFSEVREVCSTCYDHCTRMVQDTCYHQCPTFDQWCSYDYYEWKAQQTQVSSGAGLDTHWPALSARGADQRLTRTERYEVTFDTGGKSYRFEPKSLDEFRRYAPGSSWKVKVNAAGSVWPEAPAR